MIKEFMKLGIAGLFVLAGCASAPNTPATPSQYVAQAPPGSLQFDWKAEGERPKTVKPQPTKLRYLPSHPMPKKFPIVR